MSVVFSRVERDASPDRWVRSTCGLCSVGCGVEIAVEGSRIVGVRGRAGHPVSDGRLGPKGLGQWLASSHPSRGTHPFVRTGSGPKRATWDEAFDAVVERFAGALSKHGPEAVGVYGSGQLLLEEYYTLGKIVRAGFGTPYLDANTRLCTATTAASLMESFGADGPPGAYEDLDVAECIVLFGHDAAETSTVLWMRMLARRGRSDAPRIIVVDPRATLTAAQADLHLRPRPGTNVALLNGIVREILVHDWIDREFVDRHCEGFDDLRAVAERHPPEVVERITGVPAEDLRRAAEWIGRSRSTVTTCLQGVYQSHQATVAAATINSLHLLMGKIGKPGSAPFQFAGQPSSMNTRETGADGALPAYRNWEDPDHVADLGRLWNVPPELLGKKPASAPEIFDACDRGVVKALWCIGTNPAASLPDRGRMLSVLERVFLVVQDPFADAETVELADVYLPSAMWGEKTGCMTNAERRCTLLEKAVDPPGEARSDLDVFLEVARRMGLTDRDGEPLVAYSDPEGAFDEWRRISRGTIPDYSGMSYALLRETGGVQWPCNAAHPRGTTRLYADAKFRNHWRVAESYQKDVRTGHDHLLSEYRSKHEGFRARLIADDWTPPRETTDDEHPVLAIGGRIACHWHSRTKTARDPTMHGTAPEAFVEVHVDDAGSWGVRDGQRVRLVSRRGSMTAPARVGTVVPPGVVFVPFHFGERTGESSESPNDLMPSLHDPVSKQPIQKMAAVRVEPAEEASP